MQILRASPDQATTLTNIAHEAKRYWGYPENWIRHWQDDLTISPDYLASNQVFMAENEGQIIGFYALIVREDKAELDHLWVAPEHIGCGVGKELFFHAMQTAMKGNIAAVEVLSDPNAEGFYRKMGAHRIGETVSELDGKQRILPRLSVDPKST